MVQHLFPFRVDGHAVVTMIRIHRSPRSSRLLRDEIAPAHQVVRGGPEAKEPIDEASAAVPQFAKQRDGLQPPEGLLNELAFPVTRSVSHVAGGAGIDR